MRYFQPERHSRMLEDVSRIEFFRESIQQHCVCKDVVDIGSGTGILSALALNLGAKSIIGIEYYEELARFSKLALSSFGDRLKIINKSSYETEIKENIDILLTETIGLFGPEENIVEITYDFKKRHKSIEMIIPSKLTLFAQFAFSDLVNQEVEKIATPLLSFVDSIKTNDECKKIIEDAISYEVLSLDHSDSKIDLFDNKISIAEYTLGYDFKSSFSVNIECPITSKSNLNCVHIFFEAECDDRILSTHVESKKTHWLHSFLYKPNGKKSINVSYEAGESCLLFNWN